MRILIVDDDAHNRKLVAAILKDIGELDFAADGREALDIYELAIAAGMPHDLITLDIEMPNMDGHETLAAIRKSENERNISRGDRVCVLMISAFDDDENITKSFGEKCTAYIVKPIDSESLISTMKRMGVFDDGHGDSQGSLDHLGCEFI